jgi:hypothetical protein
MGHRKANCGNVESVLETEFSFQEVKVTIRGDL